MGKKILSMFVSKDMLQDVLKKEAKNTESTIQNIKKVLELKHQQEEKSRKKRKKKKQKHDEGDIVQEKKRLRSLDSKLAKYASLMAEVLKSPSPEPGPSSLPDPSSPQPGPSRARADINLKRKSRDESSEPEEPSKKKRKERKQRDATPGDISTDATVDTSREVEEGLKEKRTIRVVADGSDADEEETTSKRKAKKKERREAKKRLKMEKKQKRKRDEEEKQNELSEDENENSHRTTMEEEEEGGEKDNEEDLDILDLNIGEEDILEEESSSQSEREVPMKAAKRANSESKVTTTSTLSTSKAEVEERKEEFRDDPERQLQAAVLAQARKHRFAQRRIEDRREVSSPSVSSTTNALANYPNMPLPRYAYSYSRTFITQEQKIEHFPNLFNRFFVPLDTSEDDSSDSECEEGFCEGAGRLVTELPLVLLLRSLRMSRTSSHR